MTEAHHPRYVVWELTLACDQPCTHCGSRAGTARPDELDRDQALDVVRQLAAMGTREVVLIGGEAYLHPAFLDVVRALVAAGVRASMTTGGAGVTPALARELGAAGMALVSVSVDGLAATHDLLRAGKGSFARATAALAALRDAGLEIAANTNINRLNLGELEALYPILRDAGIRGRAGLATIEIEFGCAPDRAEALLKAAQAEIAALRKRGPSAVVLQKIKETWKRQRQVDTQTNRYWVDALIDDVYPNHDEPKTIVAVDPLIAGLTTAKLKAAAARYLGKDVVIGVLTPATK